MAKHLIILSTGRSDSGKKATLALQIGIGALAVGDEANLYLAMDGACWGFRQCSAGIGIPEDRKVSEYVADFQELGGHIMLCSRCAEGLCGEQCPTERDMLDGVEYAGMATIAELACESTVYTF